MKTAVLFSITFLLATARAYPTSSTSSEVRDVSNITTRHLDDNGPVVLPLMAHDDGDSLNPGSNLQDCAGRSGVGSSSTGKRPRPNTPPPGGPPGGSPGGSSSKRPNTGNVPSSAVKSIDLGASENQYFTRILVGSEGQRMPVLVDTGFQDLVILDESCKTSACTKRKGGLFRSSVSTTHHSSKTKTSWSFSQDHFEGFWVKDRIQLDHYIWNDLAFIHSYSLKGHGLPIHMMGIMGFGPPKDPARSTQPFWYRALKTKQLGMYLKAPTSSTVGGAVPTGGSLTLGGYDKKCAPGRITWVNKVGTPTTVTKWRVPMAGLTVNGADVPLAYGEAHIDNGTPSILGPAHDVDALYKALRSTLKTSSPSGTNTYFQQAGGGKYYVPCDESAMPSVALKFGNKEFAINPATLIRKIRKNECVGNIIAKPQSASQTSSYWTVGSPFMQGVYTVFDAQDARAPPKVGFAELNQAGC